MSDIDSTPAPISLHLARQQAAIEEARLRNIMTHEEAVLIDSATGDVIWRKSGRASSVDFDDDEIAQMRGQVLTHNHPWGWRFPANDPRRSGSSFSAADITMLVVGQLAEVRAVSPRYLYRAQPPSVADRSPQANYFRTYITTMSYPEIRYQVLLYADVVRERLQNRVNDPEDQLTTLASESMLWHKVMMMVVASWGVDYERKEWIP